MPEKQGLYSPEFEHDACGMGFVSQIKGQKSHQIVEQALEVLVNLSHRGASGSEENTGDGAGILIQLPDSFLRQKMESKGIIIPEKGDYGAGMVFLPQEVEKRKKVKDLYGQDEVENAILRALSSNIPKVFLEGHTRRKKNLVNNIQWATGMELFLKIDDPWKVFLTTDHPNAGPFTAYPWIIKMLMDKNYRADYISDLHAKFDEYTDLSSLDREYSLSEIAVISRSGPAEALGLKNKGHLGVEAEADIAVYNNLEDNDIAEVFAHPAYVFKSGKMIVKNGELLNNLEIGRTLVTKPEYDQNIVELIREDFQKYYSISIDNYSVTDHYYDKIEVIPCATKE